MSRNMVTHPQAMVYLLAAKFKVHNNKYVMVPVLPPPLPSSSPSPSPSLLFPLPLPTFLTGDTKGCT